MYSLTSGMAVVGAPMHAFAQSSGQANLLPSWNEGPAKQAILDFVRATTDASSARFVPPDERIATFDSDGTLWVERPFPTQAVFALARVAALAPQHPTWKTTSPFKAIVTQDRAAIEALTERDFVKIIAAAHAGMTVDAFQRIIKDWLASARDDRFKRPYTSLIYQPMLEVIGLLRANGYRTYIVTGGGQEFVRVFAQSTYGLAPEQVIGSAGRTRYELVGRRASLVKLSSSFYVDDGAGKPEGLNLVVGRQPRAAFGNSTGDREMLEWTQAGEGARLMLLVHHDDAAREDAYGPAAKFGKFDLDLMSEAKSRGWIVVSMKDDWKRIFPFESP